MNSHFSMRTSLWLSIVLMGVLGIALALATGSIYRELALDNQRSALTNLIHLKVRELLNGLEVKSRELASDLHREPAFRSAFDAHNREAVSRQLDSQFHRYYQTARIIKLEKLYALDENYSLLAESSEGLLNLRDDKIICSELIQHARNRRGADHLKIISELCISRGRLFQAALVPIGGLRPVGFMVVISDPTHSLIPLSAALGMPLRLSRDDGGELYRSPDWPKADALDKVLVADYVLKSPVAENALTISMAADLRPLTAKLLEARNIVLLVAGIVTLLAVLIALGVMQKTTLQPLRSLMSQIRLVIRDRSHLGEPVTVGGNAEIRELAGDFNMLTAELKELNETLENMAYSDALTGLPNRSLFNDRVEQIIHISERHKSFFALFMMDLNRFKQVNDTLGHTVGDKLLQQVAIRLRTALRKSDTLTRLTKPDTMTRLGNDILARLGGDEFAAILPMVRNGDYAAMVAKRILNEMQQPFVIEGHSLSVGISIGISLYPDNGTDSNTLVRHADVAMYKSKKEQRGFVFYDSEQDRHSMLQLTLESKLREALGNNALELYFQPRIDITSGCIESTEALLRWNHPELGFIPPTTFIPYAEQSGLIEPLTRWVLNKALEQCTLWHAAGFPISVAVNLSARSLHNSNIVDDITQALTNWDISPLHLCLELTESAIMADPAHAMEILTQLHNKGVKLSMDDFGTGYSSLAYLKKLPMDEIKIDKSFVMDMGQDSNDASIVRSIIDLAHNMSLKVVAEGVEDQEILQLLTSLRCDIAQGNFLSHPLPPDEFIQQLTELKWGKRSLQKEHAG
jgi:predicted signal transduction protein with EAL and GGDEF domain